VVDGDVIVTCKYVKDCYRHKENNLLSNWKKCEKIYSNNENSCYILTKKKANKSNSEVMSRLPRNCEVCKYRTSTTD